MRNKEWETELHTLVEHAISFSWSDFYVSRDTCKLGTAVGHQLLVIEGGRCSCRSCTQPHFPALPAPHWPVLMVFPFLRWEMPGAGRRRRSNCWPTLPQSLVAQNFTPTRHPTNWPPIRGDSVGPHRQLVTPLPASSF